MKLSKILRLKAAHMVNHIPTWVKKGDKVKCIFGGSGVKENTHYTVDSFNKSSKLVCLKEINSDSFGSAGVYPFRFQKVDN